MKEYRFLLFDADGTLLDFDSDMAAAFPAMYEICFASQKPYSQELFDLYETCNAKWWKKLERGECTKPELVVKRFEEFMEKAGLQGDAVKINELYFQQLEKGGNVLPGALELLRDLAPHYEIYIVTNGNAATQKPRLARSGVMEYAKAYFVSEEAGAAKPDPAYFHYVFQHIPDFDKEKAIVIGDSLGSDILGAKNIGLPCIWYNPKAETDPYSLPKEYTAKSFAELREYFL